MFRHILATEIAAIVVVFGLCLIFKNEYRPQWNAFLGLNPPCPTCGRTMVNDANHVFCSHCDKE